MTVSLSQFVAVETTLTRQTPPPNHNSIALFVTETPNNADIFRIYTNARDVETDYGTNALTTQCAQEMFLQSPGVTTGGGYLAIIPMLAATSATSGYVVTANLSANIAAIIAVANGDLRVIIDGTNVDLTGLNFTKVTTLAGIASVLQKKLPDTVIEVVGNTIKISSKEVGVGSTVTLAQLTGTGTDLSVVGLFNVAGSTSTAGVASGGETLLNAITRTRNLVEYHAVMTTKEIEDAELITIATAMQSQKLRFYEHVAELADMKDGGVCETIWNNIKTAAVQYTHFLGYSNGTIKDALLFKCRAVSRLHSLRWEDGAVVYNMFGGQLTNMTGDSIIDNALMNEITQNGVDLYTEVNANFGGRYTKSIENDIEYNYYADTIEYRCQSAIANTLFNSGRKIAQVEADMDNIKNAIANELTIGASGIGGTNGGILGLGLIWNGATIGNDPQAHKDSIKQRGFYIYSTPIAQQSQVDREAHKAPTIQIAVKYAGGIERVFVLIAGEK